MAVIFDVDGTLVDNHGAHELTWVRWCAARGLALDHEFYRERLYARSNDVILRTLFGEDLSREQMEAWAADKEALYRTLYGPDLRPRAGLLDLVRSLAAAGAPMGVASNAERVNVDFVVDGLGLRPYFGAVLAFEDTVRSKPDPDLFLQAAARLGVPPERCVVFEDSRTGIEAVRRAGMCCVAITGPDPDPDPPGHVALQSPDFCGLTPALLAALLV